MPQRLANIDLGSNISRLVILRPPIGPRPIIHGDIHLLGVHASCRLLAQKSDAHSKWQMRR